VNLELSENHTMLRRTVRDFVEAEVVPQAASWDRDQRCPVSVLGRLGALGLLGVMDEDAHGGAAMDAFALVLAVEELAVGSGSLALMAAVHNAACGEHLRRAGDASQKPRWLTPLAAGRALGAWALAEREAGLLPAAMQTRARRDGDAWRLDGRKAFVPLGASCDVAVVLAVTAVNEGDAGLTAFLVERGMPGFGPDTRTDSLGMRAAGTADLVFDGVRVPDVMRLGPVGQGYTTALEVLDLSRLALSAIAVGLGRAATTAAAKYALERRQFGRPIADFQAVQWMLADSATELDAARLLTWKGAAVLDRGAPCTLEASMAKVYSSEAAMRACDRALQVHGGYGYTREYPVERLWRDVKHCQLGEGPSEVQRAVVAQRVLAQFAP
jgi:alkylation response protein AidB-like acyl-CoA dehydrogenase